MSNRASNTLTRPEDLPRMARWVQSACEKGLKGGPVAVDIYRPDDSRSNDQNRKHHAMYSDIQRTGIITMPGKRIVMADYDVAQVKALCVMWFANEREMEGRPLSKPPRNFDDPITGQSITIRPSTADWGKRDTIEYIEWLYALGADAGVKWSEPSMKAFEEYREAKVGTQAAKA